ncbi:hypothetical protein LBMAG18_01130 [Alphaproteobacteria bacterium]|nr:hypothetical protein LBMAG18_01130 [Alphaproteobacteria bacterium]
MLLVVQTQKIKDDFFRLFGNDDHDKIKKAVKFSAFFQNLADQKDFKLAILLRII